MKGMIRKLHMTYNDTFEGCLQMVSTERKEYTEAYVSSRIAENNVINTDLSTELFASEQRLLEEILDKDNMTFIIDWKSCKKKSYNLQYRNLNIIQLQMKFSA